MRPLREYTSLIIIISMICGATIFLNTLYAALNDPAVQITEDKTALNVENAISIDSNVAEYDDVTGAIQYKWSGEQIILMLLVQDEYSQYPSKVRIGNDFYVEFNSAYVGDKYDIINDNYDTELLPFVGLNTSRVEYMYPGCVTGVTDSYFWFEFN